MTNQQTEQDPMTFPKAYQSIDYLIKKLPVTSFSVVRTEWASKKPEVPVVDLQMALNWASSGEQAIIYAVLSLYKTRKQETKALELVLHNTDSAIFDQIISALIHARSVRSNNLHDLKEEYSGH